jgi:hypothetical protein
MLFSSWKWWKIVNSENNVNLLHDLGNLRDARVAPVACDGHIFFSCGIITHLKNKQRRREMSRTCFLFCAAGNTSYFNKSGSALAHLISPVSLPLDMPAMRHFSPALWENTTNPLIGFIKRFKELLF